jgi:glutathione S-transferase
MSAEVKLLCDAHFIAPWVGVVWAALKEKGIEFSVLTLELGRGEKRCGDLPRPTAERVPTLSHGDFSVAESLAIVEYLEEAFEPPGHLRLFPEDVRGRARDRQLMSWLRSDLFELRRCLPYEGMYYPQARVPMTDRAEDQALRLVRATQSRLDRGAAKNTIADYDLAIMLRRLVHYDQPMPPDVREFCDRIWSMPALQSWWSQPRPATRRPYLPDPGSIDHVTVYVSDLSRSTAFYEEHLGMRIISEHEDASAFTVVLRAGAQEVHLLKSKSAIPPRVDHVSCLVSADRLSELLRELPKRSVPMSGPFEKDGARSIRIKDPDGVTWELLAR